MIRSRSRSFSFATRGFPCEVREDVAKLYAWCRCCDDAVDATDDVAEAAGKLKRLRDDIFGIYRGERPLEAASKLLAELSAKYPIEQDLPLSLIRGMEMDLELGQVRSEAELLRYAYHAAGVVGLMMCRLLGVTDVRADRHAAALGIAMQLTNIARDVREDWERGRCYLPASWLRLDAPTTGAREPPPERATRQAVDRILTLADHYYERGQRGLHYLPLRAQIAVRVAAGVYREIGQEIRRRGCRVLSGRTVIPKHRFVGAAMTAAAGVCWNAFLKFSWWGFDLPSPETIVTPFPSLDAPRFTMSESSHPRYIVMLGLSLTGFAATGLFLLMLANPKQDAYTWLPALYAGISFAIGLVANLLARRAETPEAIPVTVENERPRTGHR